MFEIFNIYCLFNYCTIFQPVLAISTLYLYCLHACWSLGCQLSADKEILGTSRIVIMPVSDIIDGWTQILRWAVHLHACDTCTLEVLNEKRDPIRGSFIWCKKSSGLPSTFAQCCSPCSRTHQSHWCQHQSSWQSSCSSGGPLSTQAAKHRH